MACTFGVSTTDRSSVTSLCIIQSLQIADSHDVVQQFNEDSSLVEVIGEINNPKTVTIEGIWLGTEPNAGDEITIDITFTFLVNNCTVTEENQSFKRVSISGIEKVWA